MATFTTSNRSTATITADVDAVWDVLTDPDLLARLTPFLQSVEEEGTHWVWQMTKVPVLGKSFSFTFRERMDFDEPHRIDFTHDPAPGAEEAAGVAGWYALAPRGPRAPTSRPRCRSPSTCPSPGSCARPWSPR